MKKLRLLIMLLLTITNLLACKEEGDPNPETPNNDNWQAIYNFDKTSLLNIDVPEYANVETIVGNGTPESITSQAIQNALDLGGRITFNSGGEAVRVYIENTLIIKKHDTYIDGGGLITLDAKKERRIIYSNEDLSWVVKNMTFRNGNTNDSGSAIEIGGYNQCYVLNCQFYDNETSQEEDEEIGGAIYSKGGYTSSLTVMDTYFEGNKASIGSCINSLLTNLTIVRCGFFNNRSTGYGGAIYTNGGAGLNLLNDNTNSFIKIYASIFKNNQGRGQGGALSLYIYRGAIEVIESWFEENECARNISGISSGGAIYLANGRSKIQRCAFIDNKAKQKGGALWIDSGYFTENITQNCTFVRNSAEDETNVNSGLGGGMMIESGISNMTNCTFWDNRARHSAGGVFGSGLVRLNIQNTIFFDNKANNSLKKNQQINDDQNLYLSDLGGNIQHLSFDYGSDNIWLFSALDSNPLLESELNYDLGFTPVLKLNANSPAKNLGNMENDAPDIDQVNRSRNGRNDSGAYQLP